jgi:hypothetical protein
MEIENLSVPLRAVFSQFVPEAEREGLKYDLKIPKKIKDRVYVDPDRIQEVIGNIISNAVKYTEKGFIEVNLSQPNPKAVRVEVVDSGPGISQIEQARLFQKFHRVESNVGKTTGTGLGLYISKLIIEKFNGKIGVKSWKEEVLFSLKFAPEENSLTLDLVTTKISPINAMSAITAARPALLKAVNSFSRVVCGLEGVGWGVTSPAGTSVGVGVGLPSLPNGIASTFPRITTLPVGVFVLAFVSIVTNRLPKGVFV